MEIVVAGGGTGGHFFPALSILKKAEDQKLKTTYVGAKRGIEFNYKDEIPQKKVFLEVNPLRSRGLKDKIGALWGYLSSAFAIGSVIEGDFRTLLMGGYASVPAGIYTTLKRKPLFLHEQNSVPSMSNRVFSVVAKKIFISFEHTRKFFKGDHVIRTGIPIREELKKTKMSKMTAKDAMGFKADKEVVLFMGGSQGARFINTLAVEFAKTTGIQTILLSGDQDYERVSKVSEEVKNLEVFPFREDMGLIYSASDVAVCRAGASTIAEVSYFKVPALFIPYPYAVDDHQFWNAKEIEELGGGRVILQDEAVGEKVIKVVEELISDKEEMGKKIGRFAIPHSEDLILKEILE